MGNGGVLVGRMKTRCPAQDKRRAEQELRELGRSMTLWFTPHGNPRKAMDIAVTFVPLENRIKGSAPGAAGGNMDQRLRLSKRTMSS